MRSLALEPSARRPRLSLIKDDFGFLPTPVPVSRSRASWWVGEALKDWYTTVFAVTGGLGSGKTHGSVQWHYTMCTRNQDSPFSWYVEPVFARINDTALPKWRKFFKGIGYVEGIHYTVKLGNPTIIRLPNQHEIHIMSGHNPDLMVGAEISHATIDEPGSCKYDVFLNVMSRLRCPMSYVRQVMLSGVPQGGNWYMDLFNFKGVDFKRRYRRFQLWTDDNVHNLGEAYLQQIEETYRAFPLKLLSYRKGEFTHFYEGRAITEYDESVHIDAELGPDPELEIYLTWDFNAFPLAWCAVQVQPFDLEFRLKTHRIRKYVVLAESAADGIGNLQDACAEFVRKFPSVDFRSTPIKVYGDRTGHAHSHKVRFTDYEQIRQYLKPYYDSIEICAARQVAPQVESIEEVNRLFSYNLMMLHPRCHNTMRSLRETRWKPGEREIMKPKGETHTHWLDALKYLVYQLKRYDILEQKREVVFGVN